MILGILSLSLVLITPEEPVVRRVVDACVPAKHAKEASQYRELVQSLAADLHSAKPMTKAERLKKWKRLRSLHPALLERVSYLGSVDLQTRRMAVELAAVEVVRSLDLSMLSLDASIFSQLGLAHRVSVSAFYGSRLDLQSYRVFESRLDLAESILRRLRGSRVFKESTEEDQALMLRRLKNLLGNNWQGTLEALGPTRLLWRLDLNPKIDITDPQIKVFVEDLARDLARGHLTERQFQAFEALDLKGWTMEQSMSEMGMTHAVLCVRSNEARAIMDPLLEKFLADIFSEPESVDAGTEQLFFREGALQPTSLRDLSKGESGARWKSTLTELSEQEYLVLRLYLEGHTGEEIALALKLKAANVRTIIFRAKAAILEHLQGIPPEEE